MRVARLWAVLLVLFVITAIPSAAAPLVGPCASSAAYDPACDVDHDGDVDIYDIQLTAGHWGQTGTYFTYPVLLPKTGQTTSVLPGDDGDLEKGVDFPNPRFTDNGDGTVTDNLTGLIWLKNADCSRLNSWWTTSFNFIIELNTTGEMDGRPCGDTSNNGSHQNDWRMPNLRELQSLIHYGLYNPAVPNTAGTGPWTVGDPFTRLAMEWYWSSTSDASSIMDSAWVVAMNQGNIQTISKNSGRKVWPVRGGQ